MNRTIVAVSLLIVVSLPFPAHADHCNGTIIEIDAGSETLYIDDRSSISGDQVDLWFYMEQNGVEGLQTGGDSSVFTDQEFFFVDYSCDHVNPDRLLLPVVA